MLGNYASACSVHSALVSATCTSPCLYGRECEDVVADCAGAWNDVEVEWRQAAESCCGAAPYHPVYWL